MLPVDPLLLPQVVHLPAPLVALLHLLHRRTHQEILALLLLARLVLLRVQILRENLVLAPVPRQVVIQVSLLRILLVDRPVNLLRVAFTLVQHQVTAQR